MASMDNHVPLIPDEPRLNKEKLQFWCIYTYRISFKLFNLILFIYIIKVEFKSSGYAKWLYQITEFF